MNYVLIDPLDKEIKQNYNELLKLQIEYQILQNNILKELTNNSIAINYPIIKYNQLAMTYENMKANLTAKPKPTPFGMYS